MPNTAGTLPGTITVAWGGDVNIGRRFHYAFHEMNARDALAAIKPLGDADLGIINLECVVATAGRELVNKGERASYYFRARPEMLDALVRGGVDLVATANNHSGDFGPEALVEQSAWLDAAGIGHAGSGCNREAAFRPVIRRVGSLDIALFSVDATQSSFAAGDASAGTAWLDPRKPETWAAIMAPRIAEVRNNADIVLVAVHWGANNLHQPDVLEIAAGHALIDAGADAVLGASAHVLQGVEVYKGRPILHDAGDLLFDALQRPDRDSGLFILEIGEHGVRRVNFTPLEIGFCKTTMLAGGQARDATARFAAKCAALGTTLRINSDGSGSLDLNPPAREGARVRAAETPMQAVCHAPPSRQEPRAEWLASNMPEDALLAEPLRVGPLELLGVRVTGTAGKGRPDCG